MTRTTHSRSVKAFASKRSGCESREIFFFQTRSRLSRVHYKRERYNDEFEQNKHHHELIDDLIF
jgi:hypothetical protein